MATLKVNGGSLSLEAKPNRTLVSSPAKGALVMHCKNHSNMPYTIEVLNHLSSAQAVATSAFPSGGKGPVKKVVGGRKGFLGSYLAVANKVSVDVGVWAAVAPGTCDLIARTDVTDSSNIPTTHNVPDQVTVI